MFKFKKVPKTLVKANNKFFSVAEIYFSSLLLLACRLWMANVFFKSGRNKFANMDTTVYLFEYEYDLPLISPVFAAYSGTFFELVCPIFLAFGLLNRFAVLPLIIMTLVIQFLVIQNTEHFYWLFLLATIFTFGSGRISVDRILKVK